MTTIRAVPPPLAESSAAPPRSFDHQRIRDQAATPFAERQHHHHHHHHHQSTKSRSNLVGSQSSIQSHGPERKPQRASGDAPLGRFSLVAFEKARRFVADLPLREKTPQPRLAHKNSLGRVAHASSASAPSAAAAAVILPFAPPPNSPASASTTATATATATAAATAAVATGTATSSPDNPSPRQSFSTANSSSQHRDAFDDPKLLTPLSDSGRTLNDPDSSDSGSDTRSDSTLAQQQQPVGKMHQTSSRLLRMTDDERPFTKDFMDLFSTLVVSLPLTAHRVRFQKIEHTFTAEEAINNLSSLKFSQSNRMPDPKDPSRIVTTTTTTTFSMAKEMARAVCQRFLDARFIEPADGKPQVTFPFKSAVWLLTPKGIAVLQRFCARNGISQRNVVDLMDSSRNTLSLVNLERDLHSDKLSHDQSTIEVIFRRFAGQQGPNIRSASDPTDPVEHMDHYNGVVGIKQAAQRAVGNKVFSNTFTGKGVVDWLMDCTTIIDRRETVELADLFIHYGLMEVVIEDRLYLKENPGAQRFQPTRSGLYSFTAKGRQLAGHDKKTMEEAANTSPAIVPTGGQRETNNTRLERIVNEPSWRLLFREYLGTTHCEENLSFYLEVKEFTDSYDQAETAKAFIKPEPIRENLAAAYGLYNAYLAPGSPNELNIDHNLRNGLAGRMTRAIGNDESMMLKSLQEVVELFKEAQSSVFKLMASDSVPKFLKDPKFAKQLREQNFEHSARDPSPPK